MKSTTTQSKNYYALKLVVVLLIALSSTTQLFAYTYSSSVVTQNTGTVLPGATNQAILTWRINSTGSPFSASWTLNTLTYTLQNTSNANITAARLYFNTSSTFNTNIQVGSTITSFPTNTLSFVNFNSSMALGITGYFFLAVDIAATTPCNGTNIFDAQATSLTWNTSNNVTINQNPTGSVIVSGPTSPPTISVTPTTVSTCSGSNITFTAAPGNGGTTPSYQWTFNGTSSGTNSTSYSTTALANGSQVQCTITSSNVCASPRSVASNIPAVSILPAPTVSISESNPQKVCDGTPVLLTAVTAANAPVYQWRLDGIVIIGATASTYSTATSGAYSVAVTENGGSGCSGQPSDAVIVNAVASPTVTASVLPLTICEGDSATLSATAITGGTFNFPVANSQSIPDAPSSNPSAGGRTQTVTVSGLPGSMAGVTISLTLNSSHIVNDEIEIYLTRPGGTTVNTVAGTNLVTTLPGQSIAISTDNGGTGAGYNNAVFSDDAPTSINTLAGVNSVITGTYKPEELFSTLTGNPNGIWTIRVVDDSYFFGLSGGNLVSWKLTFTLPNGLNYSWTSSPPGFTSTNLSPNTGMVGDTTDYQVIVTDIAFGCTKTATTHLNVVPKPSPKIMPEDTLICFGSTHFLYVIDTGAYSNGYPTGTTVDWIGIIDGLPASDSLNMLGYGTDFQVRVNLPGALCPTLSPVIKVETKTILATETTLKTNCGNADGQVKVDVNAVAPFHYVWTSNSIVIRDTVSNLPADSIYHLLAGTYCLTITDNYENADPTQLSCNSGLYCYNVLPQPPLTTTITATNVTCNGASDGTVSAIATGETAPYTYQWTAVGRGSINTNALQGGMYYVVVTDANGCTKLDSVLILEPQPLVATMSTDSVRCMGGATGSATVTLSGGTAPYMYDWYDLNLQPLNVFSPTINNLQAGVYYCLVYDAYNCSEFDTAYILESTTPLTDNNECTMDACDPNTGNNTHTPVNTNDNNACTMDACDPVTGISHTPVSIDDNNACTTDACDPVTGVSHTPVNIDDNNVCTTDACDPVTGVSHTLINIDDNNVCTTDACDPVTGVSHTLINIDDNNVCTTDACDPVTGVSHTPVNIDDGISCTIDGCDPVTGIYHTTPQEICANEIDDNCDGFIDENCSITLNVKLFIEGLYMGNGTQQPVLFNAGVGSNASIADSITIVLHDEVSPFLSQTSLTTMVDTNGNASVLLPSSLLNSAHYVAILHRNSIETWTKVPVMLGTITTINLTVSNP